MLSLGQARYSFSLAQRLHRLNPWAADRVEGWPSIYLMTWSKYSTLGFTPACYSEEPVHGMCEYII